MQKVKVPNPELVTKEMLHLSQFMREYRETQKQTNKETVTTSDYKWLMSYNYLIAPKSAWIETINKGLGLRWKS